MSVAGDSGPARIAWLDELHAPGPLPERTVLVRNEAVAHCWRRELAAAGRAELLIGTRFTTPLAAATATLDLAGVAFTPGEAAVRAARIEALLHEPLPLHAFDLEVLRTRPGWGAALASTLSDLEAAGIDAAALAAAEDPRCRDLAMLRARIDALAGSSWTAARILGEATARLAADPSLWPFGTPCLAEVFGHESAAVVAWLRAIPSLTLHHLAARPTRTLHTTRVRQVFGAEPAPPMAATPRTERDLLAGYLFAPPDELMSPTRPRSAGIDDTVHLEVHAGVEEELDAAVTWVLGEIADHATPLEQLAIVVPRLDPYATLLVDRLGEILDDGVHVIGALPTTGTSAGARFATAIGALATYLHASSLADLLPILRLADDAHDVDLSRRAAIALAGGLGTSGGSPANPAGALSWLPQATARAAAITASLAELDDGGDDDDDTARQRRQLETTLAHLRALAPALAAVDAAMRPVVEHRPLADVWPAVEALLRDHVRAGADGPRLLAGLASALRPLLDANLLTGPDALREIQRTLRALRLPLGRFGEPRVTIASLQDAVGLTFRAVRVLGLAEGVLPSPGRQDAVLPDVARATLGPAVVGAELRVLAQLHALQRIVAATTERVVLSAARKDLDGRYREPSGVLVEAAAAIGRPPLGRSAGFIPDASIMRTAWFEPARSRLDAVRTRWPVRERTRLDRAARERRVPAAWTADPLRALDRLAPPDDASPTPMDGWFPKGGPFVDLAGLSAERPISASALGVLLGCPHRFLYERVLGWSAPPALDHDGAIDALSYGTLFHATAEAFYRAHGKPFTAHRKPLDHWHQVAAELAGAQFDAFVATYPLAGVDVADAQRRRLQHDLRSLLDADWEPKKTFVDVERAFGPLPLEVGGATLHVRGYIDRIDVVGGVTLVRDLKTGRLRSRGKDDVLPAYDVQLGLYGLVARAQATAWGVPAKVEGAYVYPADPSGDDRAFRDDFDDLAAHTEGWLDLAARLLRTRTFPRTPDPDDCRYCAFQPVCGPAAHQRAKALLADAKGAAQAFATLKQEDDA